MSELFCRSVTQHNFSNSFREHASFVTFLASRKVRLTISVLIRRLCRCTSGVLSYQVAHPDLSGKKVQIVNSFEEHASFATFLTLRKVEFNVSQS